jgi:hypothetical protein
MKKISTAVASVFFFLNVAAQEAQPDYDGIFKMSPQHLVQQMIQVGGERFNKKKSTSYQGLLKAVSKTQTYFCCGNFGYDGYRGGGAEVSVRKYLMPMQSLTNRRGRQFTQGIYIGGFLQGGSYHGNFSGDETFFDPQTNVRTITPYQYSSKVKNMAAGFTIGLQRILWDVLALDFYVGAGYQASDEVVVGNRPGWYAFNVTNPSYYGVLPKAGMYVGLTL